MSKLRRQYQMFLTNLNTFVASFFLILFLNSNWVFHLHLKKGPLRLQFKTMHCRQAAELSWKDVPMNRVTVSQTAQRARTHPSRCLFLHDLYNFVGLANTRGNCVSQGQAAIAGGLRAGWGFEGEGLCHAGSRYCNCGCQSGSSKVGCRCFPGREEEYAGGPRRYSLNWSCFWVWHWEESEVGWRKRGDIAPGSWNGLEYLLGKMQHLQESLPSASFITLTIIPHSANRCISPAEEPEEHIPQWVYPWETRVLGGEVSQVGFTA